MKRINKKSVMVGAIVGSLMGLTITAVAYFTSIGSGDGSATTGSSTNVSIAQDAFSNTPPANPAVALTPDGPAQGIDFTITNPGSGSEFVNTVTVSILADANGDTLDPVSGDPNVDCKASWYSVQNPVQTVNQTIAGGGTYDKTDSTATVQLNNVNSSQNACQAKSVKLHFASN